MDFSYNCRPVTKLSTLASILRVNECVLLDVAKNANRYYRVAKRETKADGTIRETYDAKPPLKSIHGPIKCLILSNVTYPSYLHGGIRDPLNPRDYVSCAKVHEGAKTLVREDIQNFYPSVRADLVKDIWAGLCHFPEEVAECLTQLTTKEGVLPQGAKTSTALANLVFWREEPSLFGYFRAKELAYTRLVDDVNVSSREILNNQDLSSVVRRIHGMCSKYGLKVKRKKHAVRMQGSRMDTTGLVINKKVSLPHEERSRIRGSVHALEHLASAKDNRDSETYLLTYLRVSGLVGKLKRFHPTEAEHLRERLRAISPSRSTMPLSSNTRRKIPANVEQLETMATDESKRSSLGYRRRYRSIAAKIRHLRASEPVEADQLLHRITAIAPTNAEEQSIHQS